MELRLGKRTICPSAMSRTWSSSSSAIVAVLIDNGGDSQLIFELKGKRLVHKNEKTPLHGPRMLMRKVFVFRNLLIECLSLRLELNELRRGFQGRGGESDPCRVPCG